MIKLRNSKNFVDVRIVVLTSNNTIEFKGAALVDHNGVNVYDNYGFFDIIKGKRLFIFSKDDQIFIGFDCIYYLINQTNIIYNLSGKNRYLMIELPTGQRMELNYKLRDLIDDPILLLGSHEENEDYDFGCHLYNMRYSEKRQAIMLDPNVDF